jgi:hypothetical protein
VVCAKLALQAIRGELEGSNGCCCVVDQHLHNVICKYVDGDERERTERKVYARATAPDLR